MIVLLSKPQCGLWRDYFLIKIKFFKSLNRFSGDCFKWSEECGCVLDNTEPR